MSSKRNYLPKIILFINKDEEKKYNSYADFTRKEIGFICPNCNKQYFQQKRLVFRKGYSYCPHCSMSLSNLMDIVGEKNGRLTIVGYAYSGRKSSYWNAVCDCGKTHIVEKQNFRKGGVKSCGCLVKENGCKLFGKNHPNWNPNKTLEEKERNRDTLMYRKWRNSIYERDEYTCQKCQVVGARLNAHHVYQWDRMTGTRYWKSNGITLCNKCHNRFHKENGGYKNEHIGWKEMIGFLESKPKQMDDFLLDLDRVFENMVYVFG